MSRATLDERLKEDRAAMYDGMVRAGLDRTIWQNELIWWICKTLWDILEWIGRQEDKA